MTYELLHNVTLSGDFREARSGRTGKEDVIMKLIKATLISTALLVLSGCVAVPAGPGYYAAPPGYYAPAPAYYYGPPVYYGPRVGIGIYGGWRGHR